MTVPTDLVTSLSKEEYIDWLDNRLSTRPVAVFANSFEDADQFVYRVVRGDGNLAGYRWGIARKRALLEWERRQVAADSSPSV